MLLLLPQTGLLLLLIGLLLLLGHNEFVRVVWLKAIVLFVCHHRLLG
jgi:hypothetical protein